MVLLADSAAVTVNGVEYQGAEPDKDDAAKAVINSLPTSDADDFE